MLEMIRYANIVKASIVDGLGLRLTVFLQGCPRHCEGCQNPNLLSLDGGAEIGVRELAELILKNITPLHKGITFSGGDPLIQSRELLRLIMIIKQQIPRLNIWVYTGFLFEEVKNIPVMSLIDVLVDGPFILSQKDLSLKFRGSSNQRIIDVPKSLQQETVVLKEV